MSGRYCYTLTITYTVSQRKAELQQELATTTSYDRRRQLEGKLVTVERDITKTVSDIESWENAIQQGEKALQELRSQREVEEKEKRRKKGEENHTQIQISY